MALRARETPRPDSFSFNMAMSALERSKKWRLAIVLLEEMKDGGFRLFFLAFEGLFGEIW